MSTEFNNESGGDPMVSGALAESRRRERHRWMLLVPVAVVALASAFACMAPASGQADGEAAPIYGVKLPAGYRDWTLISVASVGAPVNDLRAKLGNDVAIKAYRAGTLPFPDGTIIARLAWNQTTSEENNRAIGPVAERQLGKEAAQKLLSQSFVAGPAINVQFMVKDSKKYASTGGWGFAQFNDGKPADEAVHKTCFGCHSPAKDRDFVFTRYSR
jgi:hypothetical protein